MRITRLDIEGYGVWSGLKVERLSDSMSVFYGPNEAGKTTLLEFIRTMLYGFSPHRRQYLPPVHGGRPGGMVDVAGPHGRFQISRYASSADGVSGEQITLTAPDGTRQGEHFIKVLLSNVDESVFNNVFAFGLREIQELATLSDTEAAELLYSLTAGLDRVSLVEVIRELEVSRNRILDAAGGPCQVVLLLSEREKLCVEIEELGQINHRYSRLAAERDQLHGDITRLEEDANRADHLARTADLALALRDRWTQRSALDEQLGAIGPVKPMPDGAIEQLDNINARIQKHQQHSHHHAQQRDALKREFAGLAVNDALWRQAVRIEAIQEQEPWIAQLQGQIGELEHEIGDMNSELAAEGQRLGFKSATGELPVLSSKKLKSLRSPGKLLQQSRQSLKEAKQAAADADQAVQTLTRQIESALTARGEKDLTTAMDRAGNLVSQIRRRSQLDERLDQLGRHQIELEERCRHLVDRQLLPAGVLIGLGAVFVVGVVLVLVGLFMPASVTGTVGWTIALLGLAGSGAAGVGKVMIERSNVQQLETCRKQLEVLQLQLQQGKDDRDALDAQLPRGGGPIAVRLQTAEKDLATLEEIVPLDTRRIAARQEAEAATRRAEEAGESFRAARRRWREAASAAGLPNTIVPKQVRRLIERGDRISETQRRLVQRQEELARRRKELEVIATQITRLAADAGVKLGSTGLTDQLHELAEAASVQKTAVARREAIRGEARRLRVAMAKHEEALGRLKHRRRALFIDAGVNDEQELRQRMLEYGRASVLQRQRESLDHEIQAALASQCSEDAIRRELEGCHSGKGDSPIFAETKIGTVPDPALLELRRNELRLRHSTIQEQLRGLLEKRGRLSEQIDALAADRGLASKRLDLGVIEKRLEDAVHRWQVLAATCCILDAIRDTYQKHRQPETLQEASGYLDRLTQGRYHRVWTPLGEHALRVDDAEGHSLPVEVLSRGTREQLFLSLRLALASSYARRGAPLPLVLDDVLVNFDAERAKAAAAVLRDFAAAGHQLLVFTCHEHISKMFKSLRVPVSRLPSNDIPGGVVISVGSIDDEKPKREKGPLASRGKTSAKPRKSVVESEIEDDEIDSDDLDEDDDMSEDEDGYDEAFDDNSEAA